MDRHTFEVTADHFDEQVLKSALPVLVEFTAEWCPPCKMIAPSLHALAEKYQGKMTVGMLDADLYPDYVQQYGVMGLPTLLLFVGGKVVQRMVGFQPRERIEAQLLPHLSLEQA
jgi:thioredoxin 1